MTLLLSNKSGQCVKSGITLLDAVLCAVLSPQLSTAHKIYDSVEENGIN
jgi:hypothetical protein